MMRSLDGVLARSRLRAYGIGAFSPVTRSTGASRSSNASSVISVAISDPIPAEARSEEHTSELQSHSDLVCRLLLEKKKIKQKDQANYSINVHIIQDIEVPIKVT